MTDSSVPRDPFSGLQTSVGPARGGEWAPAVVDAPEQDASLIAWAAPHAARIRQTLQQVGAILFRGFGLRSESEFEAIAAALSGGLLDYHEQATPRSHLGGKVYSSTEYPARETICGADRRDGLLGLGVLGLGRSGSRRCAREPRRASFNNDVDTCAVQDADLIARAADLFGLARTRVPSEAA